MTFCFPSTLVFRRRKIYPRSATSSQPCDTKPRVSTGARCHHPRHQKMKQSTARSTYELEVRLLSRNERHDGQLWRSLPCARWVWTVRIENSRAEISLDSLKQWWNFRPVGARVGQRQLRQNVRTRDCHTNHVTDHALKSAWCHRAVHQSSTGKHFTAQERQQTNPDSVFFQTYILHCPASFPTLYHRDESSAQQDAQMAKAINTGVKRPQGCVLGILTDCSLHWAVRNPRRAAGAVLLTPAFRLSGFAPLLSRAML